MVKNTIPQWQKMEEEAFAIVSMELLDVIAMHTEALIWACGSASEAWVKQYGQPAIEAGQTILEKHGRELSINTNEITEETDDANPGP